MNLKKLLILLPIFSLTACFSTFMISDEEAFKIGKEEKMTELCLMKYSSIPELRSLSSLPNVGIGMHLNNLAYETIGNTVFGQGRFNYIKRDYIFQKSFKNHEPIIAQGRNININPNIQDCQLYLNHYESAYYRLKAQGY